MEKSRMMIASAKSGIAFGELRTLAEQLEASQHLVKPTVSDYDLWRVEYELHVLCNPGCYPLAAKDYGNRSGG